MLTYSFIFLSFKDKLMKMNLLLQTEFRQDVSESATLHKLRYTHHKVYSITRVYS